jgi:hypothetical protein
MNPFESYLEAIGSGNAEKVASLFSEDGSFYDQGPVKMGMDPIHVTGRNEIKAFFQQIFSAQGPIKAFNVNINANAMRYDVKMGNLLFLALGVMKQENNLIKEFRVTVI